MSAHDHREHVEGCYRCELSQDEVEPDRCPTCDSDEPESYRMWTGDHTYDICPDPWHEAQP